MSNSRTVEKTTLGPIGTPPREPETSSPLLNFHKSFFITETPTNHDCQALKSVTLGLVSMTEILSCHFREEVIGKIGAYQQKQLLNPTAQSNSFDQLRSVWCNDLCPGSQLNLLTTAPLPLKNGEGDRQADQLAFQGIYRSKLGQVPYTTITVGSDGKSMPQGVFQRIALSSRIGFRAQTKNGDEFYSYKKHFAPL